MTTLAVGALQVLIALIVSAGLLVMFGCLALAAYGMLRAPRDDAEEHHDGHIRVGIDRRRDSCD